MRPLLGLGALCISLCGIGLCAFRPIFAVDLFWLLALGRELLHNGRLPTTDLFSAVHPERAWVQFQWLWELGAYAIVEASGLRGLRIANALAIGAGFAGLYLVARRRAVARTLSLTLVLAGAALFVDRFRLRPDALNFALMVPTLPVLAGGYRRLSLRGQIGFSAYCWLWSSLHGGGVLYAIAAAGALWLGARLGGASSDVRHAAARLWLASAVGAALSPAFVPGVLHFFSIYGEMSAGSAEWAPSWAVLGERRHPLNYAVAAAPFVAIACYLGTRLRQLRARHCDFGELLWVLVSTALALSVLRLVFLAIVPLFVACLPSRGDTGEAGPAARPHRSRRSDALALGTWLVLLLALVDYSLIEPRGSLAKALSMAQQFDLEPTAFPEEAIAFVTDAGLQGKITCGRAVGGPLIFYGYPALHVLADSRHNFTPEVWQLVRRVEDPIEQLSALETGYRTFGLELALLEGPFVRIEAVPPGWQLLFRAGSAEVYQRLGAPHAEENLLAARAALRRMGARLSQDTRGAALAEAGIRAGHARFLAHPWRVQQRDRIEAAKRSGDPAQRAIALRTDAGLSLQGGDDARAAALLQQLRQLRGGQSDPRAGLYEAVLAYRRGDRERARERMQALAPDARRLPRPEALTAMQLSRAL